MGRAGAAPHSGEGRGLYPRRCPIARLLGKGVSGTDPKPKVQCPGTCSRNQTSNQGRIGTSRRQWLLCHRTLYDLPTH